VLWGRARAGEAVKLATTTPAIAAGLLAVLLAGCSGHPGAGRAGSVPAHGRTLVTVQTCAAYGVYAIEHRITVTRRPPACRGLSSTDLNDAVALAILRVAGGVRKKTEWRRRAAEVAPFIDHLLTVPPSAVTSLPTAGPAVSRPSQGRNVAMNVAALTVWLVAAGSGAYLLGTWISSGGSLRRRPRRAARADGSGGTGVPPLALIGHFGLALSGLVLWVIYMAVGWQALAWAAVGTILLTAGLGMAVLAVGLPAEAVAAPHAAPNPYPPASARTATTVRPATASAPGRAVPLIIVGHGVLAFTAILLVVLATLGTAAL